MRLPPFQPAIWMLVSVVALLCPRTAESRCYGKNRHQCLMKEDWENTAAHPPLNRSDAEYEYLNEVLNPEYIDDYDDEDLYPRSEGPRCIRREYRTLSDARRKALHTAFQLMKKTIVPGASENRTEYDVFVGYHRSDVARAAHFGTAFLPWHREYLTRLELALQRHDPSVCLCYIDWTMDQALPAPSDSAVWTSQYLGNNIGPVTSGFAANWSIVPGDCYRLWPKLYRQITTNPITAKKELYNNTEFESAINKTRFQDLCVPYSLQVENDHGLVHMYVSGHMNYLPCSPNDPVFFMHHTFVDLQWEVFRQKYQNKTQRETDYPDDERVPLRHRKYDPMMPFEGKQNIDGLNNSYSLIYEYAPRPGLCATDEDCKSTILWCNTALKPKWCQAKVREGGRCPGLPDRACYSERCKKPRNVKNICKCP